MLTEALSLVIAVQLFQVCVTEPELFSAGPGAVTADVGQTVELSCETTYILVVPIWYKQRADERPVPIETRDCQQTGCRATYKKGSSDYRSVLEIRDVQVEDSGSYYCAGRNSYSPLVKGPTLLVGDSSTNRTGLLVFVPPSETNESVPLVCQVSGLSSVHIVIYWNISGEIKGGRSDPGTLDPDGSYSVRSQVLVPPETWRSGGVCTCIAQFGGAGKTRTKSVSRSITETHQGWCLPAAVITSGILVFLLIPISISICRIRGSGTRRQTERRQGQGTTTQAPILYASLEFAASSSARR